MHTQNKKTIPNDNGHTILLVEDDPQFMTLMTIALEGAGYTVEKAVNGDSALNILRKRHDFSAIIADRNMPHLDGIGMTSEIKNDPRLRKIPVIMQSGASAPHDIVDGLRAGAYYYLPKPFDIDVMQAIVKSAVRDRERTHAVDRRLTNSRKALANLTMGHFTLVTPRDAENLAVLLGALYPFPDMAAAGLYELMLNAIEHGNLGIGFAEKNRLLSDNGWDAEIERRLRLPENKGKIAQVAFARFADRLDITISDTGAGFDWKPYMDIDPSRAAQSNGRGIARANKLAFDTVTYKGSGNQVVAVKNMPPDAAFSQE